MQHKQPVDTDRITQSQDGAPDGPIISAKEAAQALARLIYDVYKHPEENGIIINGQNETNEPDSN